MRKIYAALLSLFLLLVWNSESKAQVSAYTFAQSSGTFTAISGGTTVHASGWDDNTPVSVTIPFSFTFNGTAYTSVFVAPNGYVTFGIAGGTTYTPISSTNANTGVISAFGRDLISNSSVVERATLGSAPNRQFVVQWTNARRYSGGAVVGDVLNFQIILNETTNTVQIVYGTCTATSTTSLTSQVGLRGATNTDFNNRTTTTNWATTTAGAVNSATCTSSNTIMPASGLTFTWAPPTCFAPGGIVLSPVTQTTATITWNPASPAPSNGYEWEVRSSGAGGSGAVGLVASGSTAAGVTTANVTGLVANTTYSVYIRSVCVVGSDLSSWSSATTFTTACAATTVPYTQNFESPVVPAIPSCTSIETISGNPWTVQNNPGSGFTNKTLRYAYNLSQAANSWFYTQGLSLTGGVSYRVTYKFGTNSTTYTENLKVAYGNSNSAASMTNVLADHPTISGATPYSYSVDFIPASSGDYYIGFQSYSIANQFYLFLDDVSVTLTPTCPAQNIPYVENFDAVTTPFIPNCTSLKDLNGGNTWATVLPGSATWGFPGNALRYYYNTPVAANDWFFTQGLNLTGGVTYQLSFKYGATDPLYVEKMKVAFGTSSTPAAMTTTIVDYPSIIANAVAPFAKSVTVPFTPASTGVYYVGFQAYSDADKFQLFLDDIAVTLCSPVPSLTVSAVTTTSATLNWTASPSAPSSGYEWEVRTSGAAGSGAVGLAASGTTAAGVTTANAGSLTTNTAYSAYVRASCGAGSFSPWAGPTNFNTLCLAINSFPYTETYEAASSTRSCWTTQVLSGAYNWTYGAGCGNGGPVTTAHGGAENARYFGVGYGAEQALLISPELNLSSPGMIANGVDLEFWVANPSWLGDINPLRVLYKTSAGGSWTVIPGAVYNSPINAWTKIELPNLPNISSTYYIAFEGMQLFGWGLAIDDVVIKEGPSCRKPTAVSAVGITPTSAEVTFTSPGTNFIVEYGTLGFTPGTGAAAGVGGTIVTGTASPIIVPGLTASTTYDFYVRRVCIAGVDYSENVKATATTQCAATTIPYLQTFESAIVPAMPTCTSIQDVNGNSGSFWFGTGGGGWETYTDTDPLAWVSPNKSLLYFYDFNDLTRPANDWFYTQGLSLTAGTKYRLKFFYKGLDGANFPERLEVKYGMGASASNMTSGTLFTNANVSSAYASPFDSVRVDFTPTTTGVYYIGFHAYSLADEFGLLLDDIGVKLAPGVDVGVSNITLPNLTCPANNVFMQAEIKNYNLTPVDFSVTPVNINARIVLNGTTTTNLPATVLNSGILAPNATMGVYLGTAYNFVAGTHDITLNTTSPLDPEVANDTLKRTVFVNPNPPVPVITPAAPQVCLGNSVQLTVPTPAAVSTSLSATTGPISVAVPDGSAVGATSTIAINGIPSTATITGISVTMNLTHTWVNDMTIALKAPNGKILNLFNRRGAAATANLVNTVISSASTTSLATGSAPFTGTFAADAAIGQGPTGNLSDAAAFSELYSIGSGNWTLLLRDHVGFDAGTLTNWSISINYSYIPALTWTPVTELFTNAAATTPYVAGTNAYTVYAKPTVTRTYTATSTGAGGCTSTGTVTVTVNPNPVVTIGSIPDTVCISDQLVPLVGNPVGGTWSGIGVSGNNFVPPSTAVGNYTLTYNYVNAFGCPGSATKQINVKDCPERIILLRDNAIVLFPNPTDDGRFNIRINSVLYNKLSMRVYTSDGQIVRTQQFTGLTYGRVIPIDLSALPGGTYIVKFAYEDAGPRTAEKSFKVIIGH